MDEHEATSLEVLGVTMASASIRLTVPPARVKDVQKLLAIESHGFVPRGGVHYDADEQAFVLELDGDAVSHVLDLLTIAMDTRESETWEERRARERDQLQFPYFHQGAVEA